MSLRGAERAKRERRDEAIPLLTVQTIQKHRQIIIIDLFAQ